MSAQKRLHFLSRAKIYSVLFPFTNGYTRNKPLLLFSPGTVYTSNAGAKKPTKKTHFTRAGFLISSYVLRRHTGINELLVDKSKTLQVIKLTQKPNCLFVCLNYPY